MNSENPAARYPTIVGESDAIKKLYTSLDTAAGNGKPVHLVGEYGTGREVVAREIHRARKRGGEFVNRDCESVPSRSKRFFFGSTEAYSSGISKGLIAEADDGTLYLKNVNRLSPDQKDPVVLWVRSGTIYPLPGGRKGVDAHLITSGPNPKTGIKEYDRELIEVPPLRERGNDVILLAVYYMDCINSLVKHFQPKKVMEPAALGELRNHEWLGNIRELRDVVYEAYRCSCDNERITADDIKFGKIVRTPSTVTFDTTVPIKRSGDIIPFIEEERAILKHALEVAGGKIPEAAKRLAIGRATLYRKVKKYNLR
ncbi:MAG: sigma-54-dependent Fis family transcriptional regulator [Candidatus Aenigmarchaeota archaeon]|nr:sigma-54-dependent Fis family transcriptional regulator [Candidatus Aenigmarchaeota archaeon]